MNLVAYDKFTEVMDNKSSYIDVEKQCLYTRNIAYRKYICFGKRYNPSNGETFVYIIVLDDKPEDRASFKLSFDNSGKIRIYLKSIWDYIISNVIIKSRYINVELNSVEHSDDGDIYRLDIVSD